MTVYQLKAYSFNCAGYPACHYCAYRAHDYVHIPKVTSSLVRQINFVPNLQSGWSLNQFCLTEELSPESQHNVIRTSVFGDHLYAAKPTSSVDPLGPLNQQPYFHGFLSRPEAEGLLVADGEYLIRESSKKPGQYVLTGMASGKIQHLLLMDKQGKVRSQAMAWEKG